MKSKIPLNMALNLIVIKIVCFSSPVKIFSRINLSYYDFYRPDTFTSDSGLNAPFFKGYI